MRKDVRGVIGGREEQRVFETVNFELKKFDVLFSDPAEPLDMRDRPSLKHLKEFVVKEKNGGRFGYCNRDFRIGSKFGLKFSVATKVFRLCIGFGKRKRHKLAALKHPEIKRFQVLTALDEFPLMQANVI